MITKLAFKDILHEWLLNTYLVLAISSIISPLLILFGLKFGTIQILRTRLMEDPKNREIRPQVSRSFTRQWFKDIKNRCPEIDFIIPMTRQISTTVTAKGRNGKNVRLSLMATDKGDPLLLENGVKIPGKKSCVLTNAASKALDMKKGDKLIIKVSRIVRGKVESAQLPLVVSGVLDERASGLKAVFVRLKVLEAVEDYKDGRAVPEYGWQGHLPVAYPVFNGVVVFSKTPLSKLEQVLLINGTGFNRIERLDAKKKIEVLGVEPKHKGFVYLISLKNAHATQENIKAVKYKLRGHDVIVLPWIRPIEISLMENDKKIADLRLYSSNLSVQSKRTIIVPKAFMQPSMTNRGRVLVKFDDRELIVPVELKALGALPNKNIAFANYEFAGRLNLLRYRNMVYDSASDALLLSRRGYAGFRMYVDTIDNVEKVQKFLENEGVPVNTHLQRIAEVKRLDKYLSLVFWLIATVGLVGGTAALTASLYASVERKRRELNILRLIGFLRRQIVFFPVVQGLILSSAGLFVSGLVFFAISKVIDALFKANLRTNEALCVLSLNHIIILILGVFLCSVFSAIFASVRAIRIDPAEALRDE